MNYDVVVIGSGMGSLTAAALLAKDGLKVLILERNWIPGGCTTSYWRKGFVFEAGATTLVGLDSGMPLHYLLDQTGIELKTRKLANPMQVHFPEFTLNRHQKIEEWIKEVEHHFPGNQQAFWNEAYKTSQFVWNASTRYLQFPPAATSDWISMAKNFRPTDFYPARYSLKSTQSILDSYQIYDPKFLAFVNEQLMITAQNHASEVNFLFGSAALCYTNFGNHYVDGGLINLVSPIVEYIKNKGGAIHFRTEVTKVEKNNGAYLIHTPKDRFSSRYLISGIPINNLLPISTFKIKKSFTSGMMDSKKLYSAFQMGIGFKSHQEFDSLHHQIILDSPMKSTGSKSIFLSLSHPEDTSRSDLPGGRVASVSTHIQDPENSQVDKKLAEVEILAILETRGFIKKNELIYTHASTQHAWEKWTGRAFGFVGGYPQFLGIKPWQMLESRLDQEGAYLCGDTAYPGQGIPGATLSGIIAATKLKADWL